MRTEVRVVVDTNVLISALLFGGLPEQILLAGLRGEIQLLTSPLLLEELERVLVKKFRLDPGFVKDSVDLIGDVAELVVRKSHLNVIEKPEGDNRVLECAVDGRADFVVTGDTKHLLPPQEYHGIKILGPSEFVRLLPTTMP
jgi:putative PIN family toxin of toxin-antitoxin system